MKSYTAALLLYISLVGSSGLAFAGIHRLNDHLRRRPQYVKRQIDTTASEELTFHTEAISPTNKVSSNVPSDSYSGTYVAHSIPPIAPSPYIVDSPSPTNVPTDQFLQNVQDIQSSIDSLPSDLIAILDDLEQRLGKLEDAIKAFADVGAAPGGDLSSILSSAQIADGTPTVFVDPLLPTPTKDITTTATRTSSVRVLSTVTLYSNSSSSDVTRPTNSPSTLPSFNPRSSSNIAVTYGSHSLSYGLDDLCSNANEYGDIVILPLVSSMFGPNGRLIMNDFPGCSNITIPSGDVDPILGMKNCTALADAVRACQDSGVKKVLVGVDVTEYNPDTSNWTTEELGQYAQTVAETLWGTFGGGSPILTPFVSNGSDGSLSLNATLSVPYRPLGVEVILDGFHFVFPSSSATLVSTQPDGLVDMVMERLKRSFALLSSKPLFLSASRSCKTARSEVSSSAIQSLDFIFGRFWDEPACIDGEISFNISLSSFLVATAVALPPSIPPVINSSQVMEFANNLLQPTTLLELSAQAFTRGGFVPDVDITESVGAIKEIVGERFGGLGFADDLPAVGFEGLQMAYEMLTS